MQSKKVRIDTIQISKFTEYKLEKVQESPIFSLQNIYNIATELYKPEKKTYIQT